MFKHICRSTILIRHSSSVSATTTTTAKLLHDSFQTAAATPPDSSVLLANQTRTPLILRRTMATNSSSGSSEPAAKKHTNRLAQEKSPYLLQHAHNPVDWYPWGDEAIERARKEKKLIFLSVGYSTCHWCHVMERESFENERVAGIMNEHFVNVKVDREERPDIDRIYMQFVLMMNGSGGWPMSVWLTPDLAPITAGTYFPPHDRWGMPSFTTVLQTIAGKWATDEDKFRSTGRQVIATLKESLNERSADDVYEPGSADAKLQQTLRIFKQRYDQELGGFGAHPKFPEVSRLNFLFHAYIATKDADVLDMALQTLRRIGRGGIHDHVFGGFARYSVDREWHVPHFEKMLYDQGQLMAAYANAYKLTRDDVFLRCADGIYRYLMKDLRHPGGAFYAGEDADSLPTAADSVKVEGAFYAWTQAEIKATVEANAALYDLEAPLVYEIYAYYYDVRPTGNVAPSSDPHGHLTAQNILIVRRSEGATCEKFSLSAEQLHRLLGITNEALHKLRDQRPRPHLDTKMICAWNGLVLSGLAKLANCGGLETPRRAEYMQTAAQLVEFMRQHHYDAERQVLRRSCYGGGVDDATLDDNAESIDGFLDDYAFLIKGLLDYYKSSLAPTALQWAKELQDRQDALFWDAEKGAYFYSQANAPNVIMRLKDDHDGAEPSGNSVAARNLTLLAHYYDDDECRQRAERLLSYFADVKPFGYQLPEMLSALMLHENGLDLVAVVGPADTQATKEFVQICRKFYIPGMIILHVDPQQSAGSAGNFNQRVQDKFKMVNGKPTVYICHDKVCRMPVTEPDKLEASLQERFFSGSLL